MLRQCNLHCLLDLSSSPTTMWSWSWSWSWSWCSPVFLAARRPKPELQHAPTIPLLKPRPSFCHPLPSKARSLATTPRAMQEHYAQQPEGRVNSTARHKLACGAGRSRVDCRCHGRRTRAPRPEPHASRRANSRLHRSAHHAWVWLWLCSRFKTAI